MKKLMIAKLIFLLILIGLCIFLYIMYFNIKNDNDKLEFEIEKSKIETTNYSLKIANIESDVEQLKEEKKDRVEELETWKTMEEKIKNAL